MSAPVDDGDEIPWKARRMTQTLKQLQAFVHASITVTKDRLEELEEMYEEAESDDVKESIEELYVDADEWRRRANEIRASLILKARDASVLLEKSLNGTPTQALRHEVRKTLQTLAELFEKAKDRCLRLLGKGQLDEIKTEAREMLASETEPETQQEREFQEMREDLENLVDRIDEDVDHTREDDEDDDVHTISM